MAIVICARFVIAGWWPFNFFQQNNVQWLPDGGGMRFERQSMLESERPLDLGGQPAAPGQPAAFSIELMRGCGAPKSW